MTLLKETLNTRDSSGYTPLHAAAYYGHTEEVKRILQIAKKNKILKEVLTAKNNSSDTPLQWAARNVRTEAIKEIIKYEDYL